MAGHTKCHRGLHVGRFFFEIPAPVKNQEWQHWSQLTQYLTTHLAIVQRTVTR